METLPPIDTHCNSKRLKIRNSVLTDISKDTFIFTPSDLENIFYLYDDLFFNKELSSFNRKIIFKNDLNSKVKIGCHIVNNEEHTINISSIGIQNLFSKGEKCIKGNGILIYDKLGALLNVFEHEIVHLYFHLKGYYKKIKEGKGKMYYSSHGKLFKELVFRFFGHTDIVHSFNHGDATEQLNKNECSVGMRVSFIMKRDIITGKILKTNPRYAKIETFAGIYNVPYSMLKLMNDLST